MKAAFVGVLLVSVVHIAFSQELNERYIKASCDFEGKIKDNEMVRFFIRNDIELKDITIPGFTYFFAPAKFTENRVLFEVDKIEVKDKVYAIKLAIVASDLKEGLLREKNKNFVRMYNSDYKFLVKE